MHLYSPDRVFVIVCRLYTLGNHRVEHYYQQSIKYTPLCIPRASPPLSLGIKIRSLLV